MMGLVFALVLNVAMAAWHVHSLLAATSPSALYAICIAFNAFVGGMVASRIIEESRA